MKKSKYFDQDVKGNFIPAVKLYINNKTFNIENKKTNNNFEVDTLVADAISLLNKKGYKTISSNAGHVYHYFVRKRPYSRNNLLIDENNNQYMYVMYHGDFPVKYELVSQDSYGFLEYKKQHPKLQLTNGYGLFKVTIPIVKTEIRFAEKYYFANLPSNYVMDEFSILSKIYYDFNTLNIDDLELKIINANKELLKWVKQLPNKE